MRQIKVKLGGDDAADLRRRIDQRVGLEKREIFNGNVEVGEVFLEVVNRGEGPVAFEKLQFLGFDAGFVLIDVSRGRRVRVPSPDARDRSRTSERLCRGAF